LVGSLGGVARLVVDYVKQKGLLSMDVSKSDASLASYPDGALLFSLIQLTLIDRWVNNNVPMICFCIPNPRRGHEK
jgi:hypothetical protein